MAKIRNPIIMVAGTGGGGGGEDLYETNRRLVAMKDLENSTFGGGGFNAGIYTDQQLDYIQDLFDYILRGA